MDMQSLVTRCYSVVWIAYHQ